MQKIEMLVDETLENLKYKMFKERAPFLELETTGFSELDKQIKGIAAGSITTVGSCHAALVKSLLLQMSEHFAVTLGLTVVYFSSDQKKSQICQRLILSAARLSLAELNVDDELADSWFQIKKSISQLRQTNLFIEESNFLTIEDIETLCRRISPTPSQSLVVIDSLQELVYRSALTNAVILSRLKTLTQKLRLFLVIGTQLSPTIEYSRNRKLFLNSLSETEHSDTAIYLFQDVNDSTKEEVKINILKSIGGSRGTIRLKFDMDRQLYAR